MNRLQNIDFLKVVLSLFVVAAHVFPTHEIEGQKSYIFFAIQGIARITVPVFLIITGYFIANKIDNINYIKKTTKRILIIFLVWQLIYFNIEYNFFKSGQITFKRLIVDSMFGYAHLWYLIAVVEALFLLYLVRKLKDYQKLILAIFLIYCGYTLQFLYESKSITNTSFREIYFYMGTSRNFLFYALPYLLVGSTYNFWGNFVTKTNYLSYIFIVFIVLESFYYMTTSLSIFNIFIFSFPCSIFIFNSFLKSKKQININFPPTLSLGIYLIHFYILLEVFKKNSPTTYESYFFNYFLIIIFTLISWFILDKINKKLPYLF